MNNRTWTQSLSKVKATAEFETTGDVIEFINQLEELLENWTFKYGKPGPQFKITMQNTSTITLVREKIVDEELPY